MAGIEAWVTAKRFDPIKEQIAAHPELKWVFGREPVSVVWGFTFG